MRTLINFLVVIIFLTLTSCLATYETPSHSAETDSTILDETPLHSPESDCLDDAPLAINDPIVSDQEEIIQITDTLRISNNLMNNSFVFSSGESIFFKNFYKDGQLCKMKADGTDVLVLANYYTWNIIVYGDYIYFLFSNLVGDSDLCRIPINGGETEFLIRDVYVTYGLKDDFLYYRLFSPYHDYPGYLSRINLQDKDMQEDVVLDTFISTALITEDGILYIVPDPLGGLHDGHMYFATEDGNVRKNLNVRAFSVVSNGKQVVYANNEGLHIMDYATFDNIKRIADKGKGKDFSGINIDERYVYYNNPLDEFRLYRFDIKTGEKTKFFDMRGGEYYGSHSGISIVDDYLYYVKRYTHDDVPDDYENDDIYFPIVQLKLDGSEYRFFEGDMKDASLSAPIRSVSGQDPEIFE